MKERSRLDADDKQDRLIRRLAGFPNPRKSGDGGVRRHGHPRWSGGGGARPLGRVIIAVKTARHRQPEHVREPIGTMRNEKGAGVPIRDVGLDCPPTMQVVQRFREAGAPMEMNP